MKKYLDFKLFDSKGKELRDLTDVIHAEGAIQMKMVHNLSEDELENLRRDVNYQMKEVIVGHTKKDS